MELFCTDAERDRLKAAAKRSALIFRILAAATAAVFILLCLLTNTGNAKTMHAALILSVMALGWACVAVYFLGVKESRTQLAHLEMLRAGPAEVREGVLSLEDGTIRIPKSIRIRKAVLDEGGEEPARLNIDERWASRMPPDGSRVRLQVVHSYIAGAEVPERAEGPERKTEAGSPLRKAAALLPLLGIWALVSVFLCSFVFYQIRDTDPAHKITIYMDGKTANEDALAARMEKELGGAVRMVQIHPFSYFMIGSDIYGGDLFILPDSGLDQFGEWVFREGENWTVHDPAAGVSVAGDTFLYEEGEEEEAWRLYIGVSSPHLQDGLARKAAEILMTIGKEETK